ncbi:MAG: hypothetical protein ACLR39_06875, partial [Oscillospiraceae bacterium]
MEAADVKYRFRRIDVKSNQPPGRMSLRPGGFTGRDGEHPIWEKRLSVREKSGIIMRQESVRYLSTGQRNVKLTEELPNGVEKYESHRDRGRTRSGGHHCRCV